MSSIVVQRSIGSMGSECEIWRLPPEEVPRLAAQFDWNNLGRRVFIDPVAGLITLMSPSSAHERYAEGSKVLVWELGRAYGLRTVPRGSTRWRRPEAPKDTGSEPDACYYLGATAEAWRQTDREGPEALAAFEEATPPDLVIEVERSHGDRKKPGFYRDLGVPEMWRIDVGDGRREVEILDLLAEDRPAFLPASNQFPLCTPEFVLKAVELAFRGDMQELAEMIARAANRSPPEQDRGEEKKDDWRPPTPSPFDKTGTTE